MSARPRVHVIGAGLAGLSAAIRLAERGWAVTVHEAAGNAGGRARSYHDDQLGRRIDNGNHLLLSGNRSAMAYLDTVGARDELLEAAEAAIPFVDLDGGERWTLRLNAGPLPWWIFSKKRRVAGTGAGDYLSGGRLARAGNRTVHDLFGSNEPLYTRFWEPLAVAALNTAADEAAARLLWPVMTETLARGAARARPCIARRGLSETFVDPALAWLAARDVEVRFNTRLRSVTLAGARATELQLTSETIRLSEDDRVVLAVTPNVADGLLPGLEPPTDTRPIVNAHFVTEAPLSLPGGLPLLGIIGGMAQWLFVRDDIASVTVSAAEEEVDRPAEELAATIWQDITRALDLGELPMPAARIVKEKRATFAQTPAQVSRRPGPVTQWRNLFLAGDWTDTGLPATIEGAIRSGEAVARAVGRPG